MIVKANIGRASKSRVFRHLEHIRLRVVTDGTGASPDNPAMDVRSFLRAALLGGLVAGTCDIVYAFVWLGQYGRSPLWVLQSVASGWLGRASFGGGWNSGAIGIASHYGISIVAAAAFGAASWHLSFMRRHWILCGLAYGVPVYLFMNFVVMPLSNAPFAASTATASLAQGFASHGLLFGLPIAWFARKAKPAPWGAGFG